MATKKKTMTVRVIDPDDDDPMPSTREEEIDPDDVAMESIGKDFAEGDRTIKLHRYPPGSQGGRPRYLGALIPEDFNEEFVAAHYGGGRYFGRWKRKNGTFSRYPFEIEGEPFPVKRERDEEGGEEDDPTLTVSQPTVEVGPQPLGTADVLRLISETRRETREEMRMLLEMMKPAPAAPAATEQVFSLVEKIVPLIQSGNSGGDSNPWLFALSQLKDPLMKIVDTVHTAVNRSVTVQPVRPASQTPANPTAQPAEIPEQPKGESDMVLEGFKGFLPLLLNAAASGKDPAFYADVILDQVPEFFHPKLKDWLLQEGCLDKIASLDKIVYTQAPWWNALRVALLEELGVMTDAVRPVQPSPYSNPATNPPPTGSESD